MSEALEAVHYAPEIFRAQSMEAARAIILTPEAGMSTDDRWERETAFLGHEIRRRLPYHTLLDFGCGVGRLACAIDRVVIGVDISPEMRAFAAMAGNPNFSAVSREVLSAAVLGGLRFWGGFTVWTLQHCPALDAEVDLLARAIHPNGTLLVVNRENRCVPVTRKVEDGTEFGWIDDEQSVDTSLERHFALEERDPMPAVCAPGSFLSLWRRR